MESFSLLSFKEQSSIPHLDVTNNSFQKGHCGFNVDGKCISGGHKVSGSSGYRLASLGYPPEQAKAESGGDFENNCAGCHSFPLWIKTNVPYELYGWQLKTNRLPLISNHQL